MIIKLSSLQKITPGTPVARLETFLPWLNHYLPIYGIDTKNEVASFLAQVLHESGGFKWLREIWGPTSQQLKYERDFTQAWPVTDKKHRNYLSSILGNSEKGDGKKMAGVGILQITGRANMKRMSIEMFGDERLLTKPEILATPQYSVASACIYWKWKKLDSVDDDLKILEETKAVNGGYNGLEDRQKYFDRAIKFL